MNNTTNIESVYKLIKTISTKFGSAMVVKTEPKFRGGKSCPFVGRVTKMTLITNCRFGSYVNSVNATLEKKGIETEYKAAPRKGMHFVEGMYPYILQSDKDSEQYYITMNYRPSDKTTFEHVFVLDGKVVTDETIRAEIEGWIYVAPKKENIKQAEAGLESEEQTKVVTYKVQNVINIGKAHDLKMLWDMLVK